MATTRVRIVCTGSSVEETKRELERIMNSGSIQIEIDDSVDPTNLMLSEGMLIVSGANVLATVVTAAFALLSMKYSSMVILRGKSGRGIKIRSDTPEEKIDLYIRKAKQLDVEEVEIVKTRHRRERV
jgi:hypothetical protein